MVYILFHTEIMLNGLCWMCYAESLFQYNVKTGEESYACLLRDSCGNYC